jgi:hypothetical protein
LRANKMPVGRRNSKQAGGPGSSRVAAWMAAVTARSVSAISVDDRLAHFLGPGCSYA